jgi:hypothetical protein
MGTLMATKDSGAHMCDIFTHVENAEDPHQVHYFGDTGHAIFDLGCPTGPVTAIAVEDIEENSFEVLKQKAEACVGHLCNLLGGN